MYKGSISVKARVENELAIMPESYSPKWPHQHQHKFNFQKMEWISRWGQGYLKNEYCAPRGLASKRSSEDFFKNGEKKDYI